MGPISKGRERRGGEGGEGVGKKRGVGKWKVCFIGFGGMDAPVNSVTARDFSPNRVVT